MLDSGVLWGVQIPPSPPNYPLEIGGFFVPVDVDRYLVDGKSIKLGLIHKNFQTKDGPMPTITEFLEARIAEDEATASGLLKDLEGQVAEEYADAVDERGPFTPTRLLSAQMWAHYDGQSKRRSFARGQQIARLANPARVLAECAAKQAIISEHLRGEGEPWQSWRRENCSTCAEWDDSEVGEGPPNVKFPCPTLRVLAAIYKDHEDYRPEWAV